MVEDLVERGTVGLRVSACEMHEVGIRTCHCLLQSKPPRQTG